MSIEIVRNMVRLGFLLVLIRYSLGPLVAFTLSTAPGFTIYTKECFTSLTFLVLTLSLFIAETQMSIPLVVSWWGTPRTITSAYKRIYPTIAKALEQGEEVTITYIDFD